MTTLTTPTRSTDEARTMETTATDRRTHRPRVLAYGLLDLKRQVRDKVGMFFIVALPAFLFLVFGMGDEEPYGSGNVAMYVMVGMAAYGAVTATTTVAGSAATEQTMGWGRQLGLTPLRPLALVGIKAAVAMTVAAVPIALIFGIGAATGASGTASDWVLSALVTWVGSAVFALYGLAMCLIFKGQNAASIASGLIVILSFLGNVFSPMDGLILTIGKFTPLYGYAGLARFPITDGELPIDAGTDPLRLLIANVAAWTTIFAALACGGCVAAGSACDPWRHPLAVGAVELGHRGDLAGLPDLPGAGGLPDRPPRVGEGRHARAARGVRGGVPARLRRAGAIAAWLWLALLLLGAATVPVIGIESVGLTPYLGAYLGPDGPATAGGSGRRHSVQPCRSSRSSAATSRRSSS